MPLNQKPTRWGNMLLHTQPAQIRQYHSKSDKEVVITVLSGKIGKLSGMFARSAWSDGYVRYAQYTGRNISELEKQLSNLVSVPIDVKPITDNQMIINALQEV